MLAWIASSCCYIVQAIKVSHFNTLLKLFLIASVQSSCLLYHCLVSFNCLSSILSSFSKTACTYEVTSVTPAPWLPPVLHLSHIILHWGFSWQKVKLLTVWSRCFHKWQCVTLLYGRPLTLSMSSLLHFTRFYCFHCVCLCTLPKFKTWMPSEKGRQMKMDRVAQDPAAGYLKWCEWCNFLQMTWCWTI